MKRGFTLIELVVVIAIIAALSGIILFAVSQYVNKGKDSNISGNLAVLIPAGENFYDGNGGSYNDGIANFCNPSDNSVLDNVLDQIPKHPLGQGSCDSGICCKAESQAWAACAREFADDRKAYCVDSRGMKKDICNSDCSDTFSVCPQSHIESCTNN